MVLEISRTFETLAVALLPAVITVVLGFAAVKRHDFGAADASVLIKMVMHYALPLALFVGTVQTTRAALLADASFLAELFVVIVCLYIAVFAVVHLVFHYSLGASALGALAASARTSRSSGRRYWATCTARPATCPSPLATPSCC